MACASPRSEGPPDRASRVLGAIPADGEIRHPDVRAAARMDTSTCALMLRRLRAMGLIEAELRSRGTGNGSGGPSIFYRLTTRGRALRGCE